jgi:hypothetical protein
MLSVYGDESTDETAQRVFAVAGVMGTQEEWDALENKWRERTDGIDFHATDCESEPGRGVYKDIPKLERQLLYRDLTTLLINSGLWGYGAVVDLQAYDRIMLDRAKHAPYFFCFVQVIIHCVKRVHEYFSKQQVKFTFDINDKIQFNAAFLYDRYLTKRRDYKELLSCMGDELSFASRTVIGIQVADLFTFETMENLDNNFIGIKQKRGSLEALEKTDRFHIEHFEESDFESLRQHFSEQRIAADQRSYEEWRKRHRCNDNTENRTRYLMYLDNMEKWKKPKKV